MIDVFFPAMAEDEAVKYSVIVARMYGQWVFCRHRNRTSLECPGGHREAGETPEQAARRELWEETGATVFQLTEIGPYGVRRRREDGSTELSYGMLYKAEIEVLDAIPENSEIAQVLLTEKLPVYWTYPEIQPSLLGRAWPDLADHTLT